MAHVGHHHMYFNSKTNNSDFYVKIRVVFTVEFATRISTSKIQMLTSSFYFVITEQQCEDEKAEQKEKASR